MAAAGGRFGVLLREALFLEDLPDDDLDEHDDEDERDVDDDDDDDEDEDEEDRDLFIVDLLFFFLFFCKTSGHTEGCNSLSSSLSAAPVVTLRFLSKITTFLICCLSVVPVSNIRGAVVGDGGGGGSLAGLDGGLVGCVSVPALSVFALLLDGGDSQAVSLFGRLVLLVLCDSVDPAVDTVVGRCGSCCCF